VKANELMGRSEGQHLEFKAADALKNLSKLAREVVAMLNASKGTKSAELWIGVGEREGVAVDPQGVPSPESERIRLRDHLVDTIEPRPTSEEVSVSVESYSPDVQYLKVVVCAKPQRRPFALNKDGRLYLTRIDDRVVPLDYDSLRELWMAHELGNEVEFAERKSITQARKRVVARHDAQLWLAARPLRPRSSEIDEQAALELLTHPERLTLRPHGHTFVSNQVRRVGNRWRVGSFGASDGHLDLDLHGHIFALEDLGVLWVPNAAVRRRARVLDPLAFCEYVVSVTRLVGAIAGLDTSGAPSDWLLALDFVGREAWTLPPYDWLSRQKWLEQDGIPTTKDCALHTVRLTHDELRDAPDWCAYRLLLRVYEQLGLGSDDMPLEFDRVTRRLRVD
jgi:hypothetical protein